MNRMTTLGAVALCSSSIFVSTAALGQDGGRWQFTGSLNLFLPTVDAKTVFPPPVGGSSSSIDAGKLLESLNFTFMGSLEARRGVWGVYTDLVYLDLSAGKNGSRAINIGGAGLPADVSGDINVGLKGSSWTLGGAYRVVSKPSYSLDLIGGARLLDMETKADWTLTGNIGPIAPPDRSGAGKAHISNWDGIIGVKGRYAFGDGGKWFAPYYLDIGTGNSHSTVQAMTGLGYSFGWGDVLGAWRYLGYNMKSGTGIQDLSFSGPMVSAVFHW